MSADDISFSHPHDHFKHKHVPTVHGSCFVLMPFKDTPPIVYETICGALEGVMTCSRADDLSLGGPILDRVLTGIRSAELVIAEVTGNNANVFYELGLAHQHTKNVLILTRELTLVPFDLQGLFCHSYSVASTKGIEQLGEIVRKAAEKVREQGLPSMLKGATDRTRYIIEQMERTEGVLRQGQDALIRIQAGFSSFANEGFPDSADEDKRAYGELLEHERDLLVGLLEKGATVHAILYPPTGPFEDDRWRARYDRLIEFLSREDEALNRCEVVYSVEEGANLMFFEDKVLFEGHKTGIEGGYGWTMIYTDRVYLETRLAIFDMLFDAAREHTLNEFGEGLSAKGDTRALRRSVCEALRRTRDGHPRWRRDRE